MRLFMTEKKLRQIVRDEIEMEVIREGGIADSSRLAAFNTCKAMIDTCAKAVLSAIHPDTDGKKGGGEG